MDKNKLIEDLEMSLEELEGIKESLRILYREYDGTNKIADEPIEYTKLVASFTEVCAEQNRVRRYLIDIQQ